VKHSLLPRFIVSRETLERLHVFVGLLEKWSDRINLVSKNERPRIWERHVEDCLQIAPLVPASTEPAIDMGAGAGFPGLVLAIALGRPFHLIEADHRKAAFLREASRAVEAPVTVHARRIEGIGLPQSTILTARALAPLVELVKLAVPMLDPDGACIFLKGRSVQYELTQAMRQWNMRVEQWQSRSDPEGCILHVSEISLARFVGTVPDR
jgi:16S rRNA (guanine527-N7)-methyltransferase